MNRLFSFAGAALLLATFISHAEAFSNEPSGYGGLNWGTPQTIKQARFLPMMDGDTKNFVREKREKEPFGSIPTKLVIYQFSSGKLSAVEMAFAANQKAAALKECSQRWGDPQQVELTDTKGAKGYLWQGQKTTCLLFPQDNLWILRLYPTPANVAPRAPTLKNEPTSFGGIKAGQKAASFKKALQKVTSTGKGVDLYVKTKPETSWNGVPAVGVYYEFGPQGFRAGGVQVLEKDKAALLAACKKLWGAPQKTTPAKSSVPDAQWTGAAVRIVLQSLPNGQQAALLIRF